MDWETADARDYFRCVRDDGMFVWVFSRGMEWYLHGWWD
jgi:hypothetical protein